MAAIKPEILFCREQNETPEIFVKCIPRFLRSHISSKLSVTLCGINFRSESLVGDRAPEVLVSVQLKELLSPF